MKRFWKNIAILMALPLLTAGCTTDYPELNENSLPQASALDVAIEVDQTTNYVTFALKNRGVVPMWIFGEEKVDGSTNKRYAYTQNGLMLRFRDAGTHSVEVKAYNVNGTSLGSKIVEFTLENDYRDPFVADPYFNAISNSDKQNWIWNSSVDSHFGCGDPANVETSYGMDWWAAKANEKADCGLYDDVLTFAADGTYNFDPGAGGTVYVNKDSGYHAELNPGDGNDYQVPIEGFTAKYWFEQSWSDAGIEQIDLCFDAGVNVSYIPFQEALDTPKYRLVESAASKLKKEIKMYIANAAIAWGYNFVPAAKVVTEEEMLAGTDGAGKVWVMDAAAEAHIACGPGHDDPTSWWAAPPFDKAQSGMYDDEIAFYPDGKYVFNPGPDGKIYINKGCTLIGPASGGDEDFTIDWQTQETTYTFSNGVITLPAQTVMCYVPDDAAYTNPVFSVTELTETKLTVVIDLEGISWQMKFTARDAQSKVTFDGLEFANGMLETSLSQGASIAVEGIDLEAIWVDPDFFTAVDASTLKFNAVSGDYRIVYDEKWLKVLPLKNGELATYDNNGNIWIIGDGGGKPTVNNLIEWNTDNALPMARISDNTYRITLAMKCEGGSIKLFGQAGWGKEWAKGDYASINGNGLFDIPDDDGNIKTAGAELGYYTFTVVDNGGMLDLTVTKAKLGDTTIYDPASPSNLWLSSTNTMEYYYAPGWAQIADPVLEDFGNDYFLTLPEATSDQWQAQVKFHTTMSSSADKTYDFYLVMIASEDHPGVTIKLTKDGDDGLFYFADRHALIADEELIYKVPNMPGLDMDKVMLVLDFGGNAAGTEINFRDIIFQEHREAE